MATAAGGEGALITDKLSFLRTVGGGYASLIYKLPENADFDLFRQNCNDLWDSLRHTPQLPQLLVRIVVLDYILCFVSSKHVIKIQIGISRLKIHRALLKLHLLVR